MKSIIFFMTIAIMAFSFTSCDNDDEPETPKEGFTYDGKTYALGWAAERRVDDSRLFILSEKDPENKNLWNLPYAIRIQVLESDLGKTLTVQNQGKSDIQIQINNIRGSSNTELLYGDILLMTGTLKVEKGSDNTVNIIFDLTLKNGKTVKGSYSGKCIDNRGEYDDTLLGAG